MKVTLIGCRKERLIQSWFIMLCIIRYLLVRYTNGYNSLYQNYNFRFHNSTVASLAQCSLAKSPNISKPISALNKAIIETSQSPRSDAFKTWSKTSQLVQLLLTQTSGRRLWAYRFDKQFSIVCTTCPRFWASVVASPCRWTAFL